MNFLGDNNTVTVTSQIESQPSLFSGSYTVKYQVSSNGDLSYGELLSVNFPEGSPLNKKSVNQLLQYGPKTKLSSNGVQLILSYPDFDGGGRCKSPAFVINVYERVD